MTRALQPPKPKITLHVVHLEEMVKRMDAEGKRSVDFPTMVTWYGGNILLMYQGRPWGMGVVEVTRVYATVPGTNTVTNTPNGVFLKCVVADAEGDSYLTTDMNPDGQYITATLTVNIHITETDLGLSRAGRAVTP